MILFLNSKVLASSSPGRSPLWAMWINKTTFSLVDWEWRKKKTFLPPDEEMWTVFCTIAPRMFLRGACLLEWDFVQERWVCVWCRHFCPCDMVDVVETLVVYLLWAIFCAIHFHICVVACICAKCVYFLLFFRCSKRTLLRNICTMRKKNIY